MTTILGGARRTGLLALAVGALLASALAGGAGAAPGDLTAIRIANINPAGADADPEWFTNVNGTVFFSAETDADGTELWKSVSPYTTATMVGGDINPTGDSAPRELTNVNGTLFFSADDGTNGRELWKSDGTNAGTTMVEDSVVPDGGINPGANDSFPFDLTNVNGTLFFAADDGTNGSELWKSDGTQAGTTMVANLNAGVGDGSNPDFLTNVNGTLFLAADDGTPINRRELWKSVSPFTSVTLVDNINETSDEGSDPESLTNVNGTLLLRANDGTTGEELYSSTGASATLIDIEPQGGSEDSSFPEELTAVGTTLIFAAETETDGPEIFKSASPYTSASLVGMGVRPTSTSNTQIGEITDVNGTAFFRAYDGGPIGHSGELWKSVAPFTAVTELPDLTPADSDSSGVENLTDVNGTLFFSANTPSNGRELWKHNGTTATPIPDADGINPGGGSSLAELPDGPPENQAPFRFLNVNGTLFFAADDGTTGIEPWRTGIEGPATATAKCAGKSATKVGTAGKDVISGTPGADVIAGLGGNDTLRGLGGKDVICGGAGNDKLIGGAGADKLLGQAGKDTLKGGGGRDTLKGGGGRDRLKGGPGKDIQRQ